MNKYAKTFFELVDLSIGHNSKALTKRVLRASPAKKGPKARRRVESQIRATLEQQVWDRFCLFDNGGCRLPEEVLSYRILASPAVSRAGRICHGRPIDIRDGEDDYSDMWLTFCAAKAAREEHGT